MASTASWAKTWRTARTVHAGAAEGPWAGVLRLWPDRATGSSGAAAGFEFFEHGRARGELRSDLGDDDLIRWPSTVQLNFLSRRALSPTIADIERDVRLVVVPSITNPTLSPPRRADGRPSAAGAVRRRRR
jgi:hypothetical protein